MRRSAIRPALALALLLIALSGLDLTRASGQDSLEGLAAQLQARDQGELAYHQATGLARYYSAGDEAAARALQAVETRSGKADAQAVALTFLEAYGPLFGVRAPAAELSLRRDDAGTDGRAFMRYQQLYQGVPVMAGELIVQVAGDTVLSANGEIAPIASLSVEPSRSAEGAQAQALALAAKGSGLPADQLKATEPELWVYDPRLLTPYDLPPRLVWRIEVASETAPLHQLLLLDAHRGTLVLQLDLVQTGRDRRVYDNQNDRAAGLPGYGPVRVEGQGPTGISDVDLAYEYLGDAYAFYQTYHGRDSFDDEGAPLLATVRYCQSTGGCPYENAFWNGYYEQFAFGEGMVADDVAAHEYTHAVTSSTSSLYYMYQSGAINESLSDIWGEFVDLTNGAGNDSPAVRWLIGEDLYVGGLRNMADPTALGDPDKVTSDFYFCDPEFLDYGGVHFNNGPLNKAAYLITDGGSFNGQSITGLGIEKTAHIFYELQTRRLTSGSDFLDVSSLLPAACDGFIGKHGITTSDCQQVRKAVAATELATAPPSCGQSEAPVCPVGYAPIDLFFDDLENPASGNWTKQVVSGPYQVWSYPQNPNPADIDMTNATSGVTNFWGYNLPAPSDSAMEMALSVALPAGKPSYLRFNHSYMFEHSTSSNSNYDGGLVQYSVDGGAWEHSGSLFDHNGYNGIINSSYGNTLGGQSGFVRTSYGYTSSRLNLESLAGQPVRFRFRIGTDSSVDDYGWFVDDIRIYTCDVPTPTPTATVTPTPTATSTVTATPTIMPTVTRTPTAAATPTAIPTATPTPRPHYLPYVAVEK